MLEFKLSSDIFPPRDVPGGKGRDIKFPLELLRGPTGFGPIFLFRIRSALSMGGDGGGGRGGVCDGETSSTSGSLPGISPSETSSVIIISSEGDVVFCFTTEPCFCRTNCAKKLVADILSSLDSFFVNMLETRGLLFGEANDIVVKDGLELLQVFSN